MRQGFSLDGLQLDDASTRPPLSPGDAIGKIVQSLLSCGLPLRLRVDIIFPDFDPLHFSRVVHFKDHQRTMR